MFANFNPRTNRLLAKLGQHDYDALMLYAKIVPLKFSRRLMNQNEPVSAVYFPLNSMISLLVTATAGPPVEMATIGREGVLGAPEILRGQGAMGLNVVQIPGVAVQIDGDLFRRIVSGRPLVQELFEQHLYALLRQILYGAACNRLHSMKERCARWLLMTHDRAGQDTFPITQEFLSHMLGVRRATVNEATGLLKKAGLVQYARGKLTIIDRPGLESAACGCYHATIEVYDSLFREAPH